MEKKVSIRKIIFVATALFASACLAQSGEFGQTTRNVDSGDWSSFRVCGSSGFCYWRATTYSKKYKENLVLDWAEFNAAPPMVQLIVGVSFESMKHWETDTDVIPLRLRVDLNSIRNCNATRKLNRGMQTIFVDIPTETANESFVFQLKQGNTLRIRQTVNGVNYSSVFSLYGAKAAINRAQREAQAAYQKSMSGYDPYFDGPMPSEQPRRQNTPNETFL